MRLVYRYPVLLSIVLLALLLCTSAYDPSPQSLVINGSFEDTPRQGRAPTSWWDCSAKGESPVDVHGSTSNFHGVQSEASDGKTFLGMVVRDNNTVEGISQHLDEPLDADRTYAYSVDLKQAARYISMSRTTMDSLVNFTRPATFTLYGGNEYCERSTYQELDAPIVVNDTIWRTFYNEFVVSGPLNFITLSAGYEETSSTAYNGNVLVDNFQLYEVR